MSDRAEAEITRIADTMPETPIGVAFVDSAGKPGWIGQNCPGVEVRISAEGEVLVRSEATMQGYFKEPAKTAETLTLDGSLRTGDKGALDAQGNLRITGRVKDLFKTSKGKYVAPAPIEVRLVMHGAVEACVVTGANLGQPLGLLMIPVIVLACGVGFRVVYGTRPQRLANALAAIEAARVLAPPRHSRDACHAHVGAVVGDDAVVDDAAVLVQHHPGDDA